MTGLVLGLRFVVVATLVLRGASFSAALLGAVAVGLLVGFLVGGPAICSDLNSGPDCGASVRVAVDVVHSGIGGLGRSVGDPGPPFILQAAALLSPAEVEAFGRVMNLRAIRITRRVLHGDGRRPEDEGFRAAGAADDVGWR